MTFQIYQFRRTGRTTQQIDMAINFAAKGERVAFCCAHDNQRTVIGRMIVDRAQERGVSLSVSPGGGKISIECGWIQPTVYNGVRHYGCTRTMLDHFALESELNRLIAHCEDSGLEPVGKVGFKIKES